MVVNYLAGYHGNLAGVQQLVVGMINKYTLHCTHSNTDNQLYFKTKLYEILFIKKHLQFIL